MTIARKLAILADAAKYDASCASSGAKRRDSLESGGLGSAGRAICHSYGPDGRCISLLKLLLTNHCMFDCLYCANRASGNQPRARFTVPELVSLTLDFYRRNYIEGLFLSSGIIRSPDYTMEQLVLVARSLRRDHQFRGYIHLKTIPDASPELLVEAGLYADRLSANVELASTASLGRLAPQKNAVSIRNAMGRLAERIAEARAEKRAPSFASGGQSTQMIVGADATDDLTMLTASAGLYRDYRLKRVYYSAFSPIPEPSRLLPAAPPPMVREHRLYQADWLMRFYGFAASEIIEGQDGHLALDMDPKLAWALRHREHFPLDLNRAPREALLRVPGLGQTTVERILAARRVQKIRLQDLSRLKVPLAKALPFLILPDHSPGGFIDRADLGARLRRPAQLSLPFAS